VRVFGPPLMARVCMMKWSVGVLENWSVGEEVGVLKKKLGLHLLKTLDGVQHFQFEFVRIKSVRPLALVDFYF